MDLKNPGLPPPPTDNYYKFKGLAGVWLIVGFQVGSLATVLYLDHELLDLQLRDANVSSDADALKDEIKEDEEKEALWKKNALEIDRELTNLEREKESGGLKGLTKLQLARQLERLETTKAKNERNKSLTNDIGQSLASIRPRRRAILKDLAIEKVLISHIQALSAHRWWLLALLSTGAILGTFNVVDGFR